MLTAAPLDQSEIRMAFPIISAVVPDMTLADWLRWARRAVTARSSGRNGLIAVRAAAGHLVGLCIYRVLPGWSQQRSLVVDYLIALDIVDTVPVVDALLDGLERIAERSGCRTIQAALRQADGNGIERFRARGYGPEAMVL